MDKGPADDDIKTKKNVVMVDGKKLENKSISLTNTYSFNVIKILIHSQRKPTNENVLRVELYSKVEKNLIHIKEFRWMIINIVWNYDFSFSTQTKIALMHMKKKILLIWNKKIFINFYQTLFFQNCQKSLQFIFFIIIKIFL